jgi:hypothetical protein
MESEVFVPDPEPEQDIGDALGADLLGGVHDDDVVGIWAVGPSIEPFVDKNVFRGKHVVGWNRFGVGSDGDDPNLLSGVADFIFVVVVGFPQRSGLASTISLMNRFARRVNKFDHLSEKKIH